MCGVAGVVSRGQEPVRQHELDQFVSALHHRGPDGSGTWRSDDGSLGLSHTRLAIIDLDVRSAQPMVGRSGAVIAFNGEIYNYRDLRDDLARRGHQFRTTSDTEVVLAAFDEWGTAALPRLRGMFAFAIALPRQRRVVLARDPLGIKPLYYAVDDATVRFASEIRALEPYCDSALSQPALIDLLTWGNIASPHTIRSAISALPPGHLAVVDTDGVHVSRWAEGAAVLDEPLPAIQPDDAVEAIRQSARVHLEADVEVGVFLSSGVDSTVLASLASEFSPSSITTITVRNPDSDESVAAAAFASTIGANHITVEFSDADLAAQLDEAVASLDQPSLDGINSFFVARAAHEVGLKVAISGVGGDELFGGYATFDRLRRLYRMSIPMKLLPQLPFARHRRLNATHWDRSTLRGRVSWVAPYLRHSWGPYLIARGVIPPHEVAQLLEVPLEHVLKRIKQRVAINEYQSSPNWITRLEVDHYLQPQLLRDIDAASMRNSLEVRTPLVDAALFSQLAPLPTAERLRRPAKALLRSAQTHQSVAGSTNSEGKKRGFLIPLARWIRSGALSLGDDVPAGLDAGLSRQVIAESVRGERPWTHGWIMHVLANYSSIPASR